MKRSVLTAGELVELIQDFSNPDAPIEVVMDGNDFAVDYVELDDNGIRIHVEL